MESKDRVRFKHMLDSTTAILLFIDGKTRKHLKADRMFRNAVIRELEILGEAANHISKITQKNFPELPWKQLIAMRNMLIHAYFDVDHDVIWETVTTDVPPLYLQLKMIVSDL